ncbi:19543_t:CDS:1 [Funneliformis geosporum]|uniref:Mitochondrial import inner membrane translocase subunit TIM50 n=1 Tax=Funneliformis geosporum TaxID=1117311 RepID=A0A9W4WHN5_9GLOM|nr:10771_t:CDS:1 [Funneliformis geosporum]CAI2180511.1 19543_t:CDS:1 [Funneliformis geosporum]
MDNLDHKDEITSLQNSLRIIKKRASQNEGPNADRISRPEHCNTEVDQTSNDKIKERRRRLKKRRKEKKRLLKLSRQVPLSHFHHPPPPSLFQSLPPERFDSRPNVIRNDYGTDSRNNNYIVRESNFRDRRNDDYIIREPNFRDRRNDDYILREPNFRDRRNDDYIVREPNFRDRRNDYIVREPNFRDRRNDVYVLQEPKVKDRRNDDYIEREPNFRDRRNNDYNARDLNRDQRISMKSDISVQQIITTYASSSYLEVANVASVKLEKPSQKLLVLDLNGTLVYRDYKKSIEKRPHMENFLRYIFESNSFIVMVWSSAQPYNVNKMVDVAFGNYAKKLAAIWTRDEFNLSPEDYKRKVETIKDLEIVWKDLNSKTSTISSQIVWDQTNTILMDDSSTKSRIQPYNAIHLPEFEMIRCKSMNDNDLSNVIEYLTRLHKQSNVSSYIKENPYIPYDNKTSIFIKNEPGNISSFLDYTKNKKRRR